MLEGKKHLIKLEDVKMTMVPPKVNDLKVIKLWDIFKNDQEFLSFSPYQCVLSAPPRDFFFAILSTVKPNEYQEILNRVEANYWQKLNNNSETIQISPLILGELNSTQPKNWMMSKKGDKRVKS